MLRPHEVSRQIKFFRKPKTTVKGDVFPDLVTKYCDFFAIPLTLIYNEIASSKVWPVAWKTEYVTVMPKNGSLTDFGDLRNISCTMLVSKMMESYVLEWAMEEVTTKLNQYGGVRSCSGTHLILKVWQKILQNLEDRRAATVLTSIDYTKAFNRLSFQHCLKAFAQKGSSSPVLRLLATFLSDKTMTVRVGNSWSTPRPVTGGYPQGSILGVFLFNVTTDDLEDGSSYVSDPGVPEPAIFEDFHHLPADVPADVPDEAGYVPIYQEEEDSPQSDSSYHTALGEDLVSSTPIRPRSDTAGTAGSSPDISPDLDAGRIDVGVGDDDNGPGVTRAARRIVYSSEEDVTPPPEPTRTCLGPWKSRPVDVDKYVDDNLQEECLNFENAPADIALNTRMKHAIATQNVFRHVVRNAERKGMKVNAAKTNMICISDSQNFKADCYILDSDQNRIQSSDKMKVLGWHFSPKPNASAYIEVLARRFRERYWTLRHLKHNGFTSAELVHVYTSIIRPVADYMMEVYHSMLTDRQDEMVERLQMHALKCIFGPRISARRMRGMAEIGTLRERRIEACDKFAQKCVASDRFEVWFPKNEGRRTRKTEEYVEEYARCDRLFNSPIFYMRRRLNGKAGRTYGERNKQFRE